MQFEWDEDKRQSNLTKHGIDFLRARVRFDRRPGTQTQSSYADEERYISVGVLNYMFVAAIWTNRNRKVRFISVRRARRQEIASYHGEHSNGSYGTA
jgi:uncharacterized DUF497 family protein